jgi:hypothetical protein
MKLLIKSLKRTLIKQVQVNAMSVLPDNAQKIAEVHELTKKNTLSHFL